MNEELRIEVFNGHQIEFTRGDAFVNLTKMCEPYGKRPGDFLAIGPTKEFLAALAEEFNSLPAALVVKVEGKNGGTWAHRRIAIKCAAWLNSDFEVWMIRMTGNILMGQAVLQRLRYPARFYPSDRGR